MTIGKGGLVMSVSSSAGTGRTTTVGKIVLLLEAVAMSESAVGVRQLARDTRTDKSAVSRLLQQLESMAVVEQTSVSGQFSAGPRLFALAASLRERDSLWRAAEPVLRGLMEQFNESCYLTTRDHGSVVFRERIECTNSIRYVIEQGERSPLHAGAGGRAILSGLATEEVEKMLVGSPLEQVTAGTVVDPDEIRRQVARDRDQGYSLSRGERSVGGCGIAAPYFSASGECSGSLLYTCPIERFDLRRAPEIGAAVAAAADALSSRLGRSAWAS